MQTPKGRNEIGPIPIFQKPKDETTVAANVAAPPTALFRQPIKRKVPDPGPGGRKA